MADEGELGTALDGGVASDVRVVETADGPIVIKKALAKLKVAADWFSNPARSMVEVAAIEAFGRVGGRENVPEVVWVRPDENCFAMRLVDPRFKNWKTELLAGRANVDTARRVGEILGAFHRNSAADPSLAIEFNDLRFFTELRIEPFFDYVAQRKPELRSYIQAATLALIEQREALVHGDYSPKNILVDKNEAVVLDFEVTHWGNPRFDVGFCLAHLMLKSALRDGHPRDLSAVLLGFIEKYEAHGLPVIDRDLACITGCLLLARLYGKSPADYLNRLDTEAVERKAIQLLKLDRPPASSDFILFPEFS